MVPPCDSAIAFATKRPVFGSPSCCFPSVTNASNKPSLCAGSAAPSFSTSGDYPLHRAVRANKPEALSAQLARPITRRAGEGSASSFVGRQNYPLPQQVGSHPDQLSHFLSLTGTESHKQTNPLLPKSARKKSRSRATSGGAKPITRVSQSLWRGSSVKKTAQTRKLRLR